MEDSVTENEKLQVLSSSIVDEDEKEGAAKEVMINGEDVVQEKPAVGFINHIISNFTPRGGEVEEQERNDDDDDDVEEKPIGLINQIISSFAPEDKEQQGEVIEKEEDNRGGGGVFSHIMSNLVSSPVSIPNRGAGDDVLDNAKTQEKQGNGLIDNIVSNLPTPLPDDAAPASDEASILIHSIIHD